MSYHWGLLITLVVAFICFTYVTGEAVIQSISCDEHMNDVDRAKLYVQPISSTTLSKYSNLALYTVNEDCYKCSKTLVANFGTSSPSNTTQCFSFWTPFEWTMYLMTSSGSTTDDLSELSNKKTLFGDQGQYSITIDEDNPQVLSIDVDETEAPVDPNIPLYILIAILTFIAILSFGVPYLIAKFDWQKKYSATGDEDDVFNTLGGSTATGENQSFLNNGTKKGAGGDSKKKKKSKRLSSLDTFRGIALLLMIFVNYGGGGYWFFEHAAWNGLTLADLVFPWFMWIMGVSMALSFNNILPKKPISSSSLMNSNTFLAVAEDNDKDYQQECKVYNSQVRSVWMKVTVRAIKLFLLGMFLANGYEYTTWRVPGVLQYFGVSYFVTAATILFVYPYSQDLLERIKLEDKLNTGATSIYTATANALNESGVEEDLWDFERLKEKTLSISSWSRLLTAYRYEWIIQIALIVFYWIIALGVAAPGCPVGYNGPGGISENTQYNFCTGGIHRYVDLKAFGYWFIYHHPTCLDLYHCRPYDPEGLVGVLSACSLTYIGLMVGRIFLHYPHAQDRLSMLFAWAFGFLLLAGILCGFSQNEGFMPVNKNLWSTSFIFVTAGFGMVGLSLCYLAVDVYKVWSGAPFIYLGMNSIMIYMGHQLLQEYMPFSYEIDHFNHGSLLLCHTMGTFAWVLIAYYCYINDFFIKV
jgi:heparan-alpha-glucosaminide N-acetyltransferase